MIFPDKYRPNHQTKLYEFFELNNFRNHVLGSNCKPKLPKAMPIPRSASGYSWLLRGFVIPMVNYS